MDEQYTQEAAQEADFGKVYFEIVESGDYTDKKLQREFGSLVLSRRPLWNRVCEGMALVSMVILMLVFLEMGLRPSEMFLGWSIKLLCIGFAIGCAIVAVWGAVYLWLFRPRLIARKRLARFKAPDSTVRYYEDKVVSVVGEGERTELPYHDLPWEKIYVGEHALYLEVKLLSLFSILKPEDFTVGDPDAFPAFLWEKAGVSAKDIT